MLLTWRRFLPFVFCFYLVFKLCFKQLEFVVEEKFINFFLIVQKKQLNLFTFEFLVILREDF